MDTMDGCIVNGGIVNGWLRDAIACPSPNFNQRPVDAVISLLVIHNISLPPGEFSCGYVPSFFRNQLDVNAHPYFASIAKLRVSAHLFIARDGQVTQFVSFENRAWHAGVSSYEGVSNCNDFSVGIELEGTDDILYTDSQYLSLQKVTRQLLVTYPTLTPARITGHEQIAPGRKTDPGFAFDWSRYLQSLVNE
jgi:AmpD protein